MAELSLAQIPDILRNAGLLTGEGPFPKEDRAAVELVTDHRLLQKKQGAVFLAIRGGSFDGHTVLDRLPAHSASLVIGEDDQTLQNCGLPWLQVSSSRAAWSWLAAAASGNPQAHLQCFGITGTNGKTSTVWLIRELLRLRGESCLTIGTTGAVLDDQTFDTGHTTPDPPRLFALLAKAVQAGVRYVAMEVSSHALMQEKTGPLRFAAVALTSFSRDHLDYHGSMDDYLGAKWRLFGLLKRPDNPCLISSDARSYGRPGPLPAGARWIGMGEGDADIRVECTSYGPPVCRYRISGAGDERSGALPLIGDWQVLNFAIAFLLVEGVAGPGPVDNSGLHPVPGRMEPVGHTAAGPWVYVDYAHTPDALQKALALLRHAGQGRLLLVFGCGGDRDTGKRPEMGRVAAALADRIIVTSDNPRSEDPEKIIRAITAGLSGHKDWDAVTDRRAAIRRALREAGPGDRVLIAGKGHEDYQEIRGRRLPFDDRLVVADYLGRGKGAGP